MLTRQGRSNPGGRRYAFNSSIQWLALPIKTSGSRRLPRLPAYAGGRIAGIKGLEFKAVALVSDNRRPAKPDEALRARFEHYVAATRAREWLLALTLG